MSKNPSPAKSTAKDELSLDDLEKIAGGTGAAPPELSLTPEQGAALMASPFGVQPLEYYDDPTDVKMDQYTRPI